MLRFTVVSWHRAFPVSGQREKTGRVKVSQITENWQGWAGGRSTKILVNPGKKGSLGPFLSLPGPILLIAAFMMATGPNRRFI